jgi:hypothetical protein
MGFGALPLATADSPWALTTVTRDIRPAAVEEKLLLACEVRPCESVDAKTSLFHLCQAL